jgi:hypothetical protein
MELKAFKPRTISLYEDFVGFPLIHEELSDIVNYLGHLDRLSREGKDDYRRMLVQAECGALFLGRTGTGKTHALHCVVNEATKQGYYPIDGSIMLGKTEVDPRDVREFFDLCRSEADDRSLLIVYDDARQLLGSRDRGYYSFEYGHEDRETRPMREEFRRQIDSLQFFDHPTYIIITSATSRRHIDRQISRRFSRHVTFPRPRDESRRALFEYYLRRFGHNSDDMDIVTLSFLMDGVVAGRVEEIVSKASYKGDMKGGLTNKLLVKEISRFIQGPPVDTYLTDDMKMLTGYHEFGGHTLTAYAVGLEPILVSIEPSADGSYGKSFHRHSLALPQSSAKYHFAEVVTRMGSTAVYLELEQSIEEGRMNDLTSATRVALELYSVKNPMVKLSVGKGTYLSEGLFSEDNREEIEGEIEKIKGAALEVAKDIVRNYKDEIFAFTRDHLVKNEIMVRNEIMDVLKEMGVEPGCHYQKMCDSLNEIGYPV